jgi:hypothetical protein
MRISLNNVWLTNDGATDLHVWTDAHGVQLNGRQIVQDAQFLRALAAQPLARGNAVNELRFAVTRQFSSVAAASAAVLTSFSTLPGSGAATIVCGAAGETPETCTFMAVLAEMPVCTFHGTRTDMTFVLRGGAMTAVSSSVAALVDAASFSTNYTYAPGGTMDGGNLADALVPSGLDLDGGSFS